MHTASCYANSGTGEEELQEELQSRVGTPAAGFTTKAFVVELPTVCSEHTDKTCPRGLHCRNNRLPRQSDETGLAPALQDRL